MEDIVFEVEHLDSSTGTGTNGWTPELAIVNDGDRRVQQVVDWFGGGGTKPAIGEYVGPAGFVTDIAQAVAIQGPAGEQGPQGIQGVKGDTGDQGPAGSDGADGDSAYQIWLDAGNTGSEADFLLSLKGAKGDTGDQGVQGIQGIQGEQGPAGNDGADGEDGADGAAGRSVQVFDEIPSGDFGTDFFAGDVVLL